VKRNLKYEDMLNLLAARNCEEWVKIHTSPKQLRFHHPWLCLPYYSAQSLLNWYVFHEGIPARSQNSQIWHSTCDQTLAIWVVTCSPSWKLGTNTDSNCMDKCLWGDRICLGWKETMQCGQLPILLWNCPRSFRFSPNIRPEYPATKQFSTRKISTGIILWPPYILTKRTRAPLVHNSNQSSDS
jgi:hypothetical protein